jgi:hypothetical protein
MQNLEREKLSKNIEDKTYKSIMIKQEKDQIYETK